MKSNVFPQVNDALLVNKINTVLTSVLGSEKIFTNTLPIMASEDFNHLVSGNQKTTCDFILVGTANPEVYAQAIQEGKRAPFFNHNGNYQVDLAGIPLGVQIGVTALLELFRK